MEIRDGFNFLVAFSFVPVIVEIRDRFKFLVAFNFVGVVVEISDRLKFLKVLDTWKVTRLNLLRQKSVKWLNRQIN